MNENKKGHNIFCDWINDVDYLKRHLICEATVKVIEIDNINIVKLEDYWFVDKGFKNYKLVEGLLKNGKS